MGTTVGYRIKFACNAKNSDGAPAGFYGNCLPFWNLIKLTNNVFCHLPRFRWQPASRHRPRTCLFSNFDIRYEFQ